MERRPLSPLMPRPEPEFYQVWFACIRTGKVVSECTPEDPTPEEDDDIRYLRYLHDLDNTGGEPCH